MADIEAEPVDTPDPTYAVEVAREIVRRTRRAVGELATIEIDHTASTDYNARIQVMVGDNSNSRTDFNVRRNIAPQRGRTRPPVSYVFEERTSHLSMYGDTTYQKLHRAAASVFDDPAVLQMFQQDIAKHTVVVKVRRVNKQGPSERTVFGVRRNRVREKFIDAAVQCLVVFVERFDRLDRTKSLHARAVEEAMGRMAEAVGSPGLFSVRHKTAKDRDPPMLVIGTSGTVYRDTPTDRFAVEVAFTSTGDPTAVQMTVGMETGGAAYASRIVRAMLAAIEVGYHQKELGQ